MNNNICESDLKRGTIAEDSFESLLIREKFKYSRTKIIYGSMSELDRNNKFDFVVFKGEDGQIKIEVKSGKNYDYGIFVSRPQLEKTESDYYYFYFLSDQNKNFAVKTSFLRIKMNLQVSKNQLVTSRGTWGSNNCYKIKDEKQPDKKLSDLGMIVGGEGFGHITIPESEKIYTEPFLKILKKEV